MLYNIRKELKTNSSEVLDEAISLIDKQLRKGNDYIAIDSIYDWPEVNGEILNTLGSFLMRETFILKNINSKKFEVMLFQFENVIVFTIQASIIRK